jgi:hypothetical protein
MICFQKDRSTSPAKRSMRMCFSNGARFDAIGHRRLVIAKADSPAPQKARRAQNLGDKRTTRKTLASFIELGVAAEDALLVEGDAPL